MAMADSVTVSMGELTMGTRSLMLRVTNELRSTCCGRGSGRCDTASYLVGRKVDEAGEHDHIVIGVAHALAKQLSSSKTCA